MFMGAKKNIGKHPVGELCLILFVGAIGLLYFLQLVCYIILFVHRIDLDMMYYWVEPYWYICIQGILCIAGLLLVGISFKNRKCERVFKVFDIFMLIPLMISLILVFFHRIA